MAKLDIDWDYCYAYKAVMDYVTLYGIEGLRILNTGRDCGKYNSHQSEFTKKGIEDAIDYCIAKYRNKT